VSGTQRPHLEAHGGFCLACEDARGGADTEFVASLPEDERRRLERLQAAVDTLDRVDEPAEGVPSAFRAAFREGGGS